MPIGALVGIGAAGMFGQAAAGGAAAKSQERIAMEQQRFAREIVDKQEKFRERLYDLARTPRPEEIQALGNMVKLQESAMQRQQFLVQREQQLLNATDPAILEAGKQAYQILTNGESNATQPINKARALQRERMVADLAARGIDPSSSAGIESLNKFDDATHLLQQQTLGSLLSVAQGGQASAMQGAESGLGQAQGTTTSLFNFGDARTRRELGALMGAAPDYGQLVATAGAQHVGGLGQAQMLGNLFGGISQAGFGFAGQELAYNRLGNLFKKGA